VWQQFARHAAQQVIAAEINKVYWQTSGLMARCFFQELFDHPPKSTKYGPREAKAMLRQLCQPRTTKLITDPITVDLHIHQRLAWHSELLEPFALMNRRECRG
jgi:hypothetical protein